jgi:quinol monooxygenase YgiN
MDKISRIKFLSLSCVAAASISTIPINLLNSKPSKKQDPMYGLIGNITATAGQRDNLIEILLNGIKNMPGCLSYIVSKDSENDDVIWITEVWDNKQSHQASLTLPSVREAINNGRPLIKEFGNQKILEPVGGQGL